MADRRREFNANWSRGQLVQVARTAALDTCPWVSVIRSLFRLSHLETHQRSAQSWHGRRQIAGPLGSSLAIPLSSFWLSWSRSRCRYSSTSTSTPKLREPKSCQPFYFWAPVERARLPSSLWCACPFLSCPGNANEISCKKDLPVHKTPKRLSPGSRRYRRPRAYCFHPLYLWGPINTARTTIVHSRTGNLLDMSWLILPDMGN